MAGHLSSAWPRGGPRHRWPAPSACSHSVELGVVDAADELLPDEKLGTAMCTLCASHVLLCALKNFKRGCRHFFFLKIRNFDAAKLQQHNIVVDL